MAAILSTQFAGISALAARDYFTVSSWPGRIDDRAAAHSATRHNKSASRFDLLSTIMMAILRPAGFCSYSMPLSKVRNTLKPSRSGSSNSPLLLARKTSLRHSFAIMPGKTSFEFRWNTLVEENLHSRLLTTRDFACSRAATAFARVTVGKSSRNSSSVCPPSR